MTAQEVKGKLKLPANKQKAVVAKVGRASPKHETGPVLPAGSAEIDLEKFASMLHQSG